MYNATQNYRSKIVIRRGGLTRVLHSDFSLEDADCLVLENVHITPQALDYINDTITMCRPRDADAALSIALNNLRPDRSASHIITELVCR